MDTSISSKNINDLGTPNTLPTLITARKRFVFNVLSNATYIGAQAALTFWMTPYLIGYLGIAAFGMIPLTQNLISYTSILTEALNTAIVRFLTIELGQHQVDQANKTFNTSFFSILGLFLILTPVVLTISLTFSKLFNIPTGWEADTSLLFVFMAGAFFTSVTTGVFSVSTFMHSEFVKLNLINLTGLVFRVGCLVFLYSLFPAHLWYAGAGFMLAASITLVGSVFLWRKLTPELKIMRSAFDRSRLNEQLGMGGWVVVNTAGALLMARADLIIVNGYFGAVISGGYASIVQFTALMEYLVAAVGGVIRPIILLKFSQDDILGLQKLCIQSVKLYGYALSLPVGLLCGFSIPFLKLWLGPAFQNLSILMVAILFHQALNYSVRPMLLIHTAFNKVRWPGIVTLLCGMGSVILGILMAKWSPLGAIGVALAVGLTWTIKNSIYMPIYTAHIMKLKWWVFFPSLLPSVMGTLIAGGLTYWSTYLRMPGNWIALAGYAIGISVFYAIFVWLIGLNRDDRQLIWSLLPFLHRGKKGVLHVK